MHHTPRTVTKGDFMKLREQFGENSFDAVYAIEATCHAPSWEGIYGEIFRVLKPGGYVSRAGDKVEMLSPLFSQHRSLGHSSACMSGA